MTTTPAPPAIEGLSLWLDALLSQLRRNNEAMTTASASHASRCRAALDRAQEAADQAERERHAWRYDEALASRARAALILRDDLYPGLTAWMASEPDPVAAGMLLDMPDHLDILFDGGDA